MDYIKDAFNKVKTDMGVIGEEIDGLKLEISQLRFAMNNLTTEIKSLKLNQNYGPRGPLNIQTRFQNTNIPSSTHRHITQTDTTDNATDNYYFKPLKDQNIGISTGNQGVPTDRQTDKQTNRHIENTLKFEEITPKTLPISEAIQTTNPIQDAAKILESLDSLKKEIRLRFKRLTEKEILVFSTLYQLDDEKGYGTYKEIAKRLNLTESSIRDYIGRLINKGVSVDKMKINNKNIHLKIAENLKKVASLSTILQLRDL